MAKDTPTPVIIAEEQPPVPVTITPASLKDSGLTATKGEGTTLPPTTTEAEDIDSEATRASSALVTYRQSRINLIWEATQSFISILIVGALIYCSINNITTEDLSNAAFLIIGFYFSRTNHQAIGGVGSKPTDSVYRGR